MSEKKITALSEILGATGDDLLMVVDNPSGTPINKKISVQNFVGNLALITASTGSINALSMVLTCNNAHTGNTIVAGRFTVQKNGNFSGNNQFGIVVESLLGAAGAHVVGTHAAALFTTDPGQSASIGNTYGIIIDAGKANASWTRASAPRAFIAFGDDSPATQPTEYLFDIGRPTKNVSGNATSTTATHVFMQASDTTITRKLRVRVNGTTYFLCLTDNR
jgi:hypothetical protein